MTVIFRPTDHLIMVVGSGREAMVSTQGPKRAHLAVLPDESPIDEASIVRSRVEKRAASQLSQWIRHIRLRDTCDQASVILHIPSHAAVWPAQGAQIDQAMTIVVTPNHRVPARIACEIGIPGGVAAIIHTVPST